MTLFSEFGSTFYSTKNLAFFTILLLMIEKIVTVILRAMKVFTGCNFPDSLHLGPPSTPLCPEASLKLIPRLAALSGFYCGNTILQPSVCLRLLGSPLDPYSKALQPVSLHLCSPELDSISCCSEEIPWTDFGLGSLLAVPGVADSCCALLR